MIETYRKLIEKDGNPDIFYQIATPRVLLYIKAVYYIYTNYIFLDSTYNTDSHCKILAVRNNFEKKKVKIILILMFKKSCNKFYK